MPDTHPLVMIYANDYVVAREVASALKRWELRAVVGNPNIDIDPSAEAEKALTAIFIVHPKTIPGSSTVVNMESIASLYRRWGKRCVALLPKEWAIRGQTDMFEREQRFFGFHNQAARIANAVRWLVKPTTTVR